MDNLHYLRSSQQHLSQHRCPLYLQKPKKLSYEHATKTLTILTHNSQIYFYQYAPDSLQLHSKTSTKCIDELQGQNVLCMEYIVDAQAVLFMLQSGSVLVVKQDGDVQLVAENEDGICGGCVSPTQQYIYIVTKNNTLIQLDTQYNLIKQTPLDDNPSQTPIPSLPTFSFKPDGSFFNINFQTDKGRKSQTRDSMLGIFRSPSKSDPQQSGLVQSVSEKSRQNMRGVVAWQPNGGIIAGADYVEREGVRVYRVIFWQKNGLRHLQFQLPGWVSDVVNLSWSPDSAILYVQTVDNKSEHKLCLYNRSNYSWSLKSVHTLQPPLLYFHNKQKHNQVFLITEQPVPTIHIYQYCLQTTPNKYLSSIEQQTKQNAVLQVCVHGNTIRITDFMQGVMPPPMCHCKAQFQDVVMGVAVWSRVVLVVEGGRLWCCWWGDGQLKDRQKVEVCQELKEFIGVPVKFRILEVGSVIKFSHRGQTYSLDPQTMTTSHYSTHSSSSPSYTLSTPSLPQPIQLSSTLTDQSLSINQTLYSDHVTSYTFYHEFLIFTVASSGMYDKLFIFDLELDAINAEGKENKSKESVLARLTQFQGKKELNYRAIQRGAKIVGCCADRVILQLPRGNLQTIYPKVITIKSVAKSLSTHNYLKSFQTIRTHKLDFNLLFDINPSQFPTHISQFLPSLNRTDYINLFISQLKDTISSQLIYCIPQSKIQQNKTYIELSLENKKVGYVCQMVSKCLRGIDMDKYVLSVYTAEIKMGKLEDVLFQIMGRKKEEVEVTVVPHLEGEGKKKKKGKIGAQEVLEYVCWLVDANAIYEASLLTYDLQLASMTARCTQMDPKQYIPYLESLKQLSANPIALKHRICLDLKNYPRAILQLSKGTAQDIKQSLQYVKKHKLFKCGLNTYKDKPEYLKEVRMMVVDELIEKGENGQAYKMCLYAGELGRALEIAMVMADGGKIGEVLQCQSMSREQKEDIVRKFIEKVGEQGFKNKVDLAQLKSFLHLHNESTILYIRSGNYIQAYKQYLHTTPAFKQTKQLQSGMQLQYSLHRNLLLKQKSQMLQKSIRLQKVHRLRATQGLQPLNIRNADNDDMYSQVSVSSKAVSQYTVSTTTGMRKKKDKKRSILSRNVKEGSPLQEEYLVTFLHDLLSRVDANIKQSKQLIQHLIYVNLIEEAQNLRNVCRDYGETANKCVPKYYAQNKFEADHPEYRQLLDVYENKGVIEKDKGKERRDRFAIDSFNYLF